MDFSKESIFTNARSHKKFGGDHLSEKDIKAIYELAKLAPTANNSCPLRIGFVNTLESIERLAKCALEFNQEKTLWGPKSGLFVVDVRRVSLRVGRWRFKCRLPVSR